MSGIGEIMKALKDAILLTGRVQKLAEDYDRAGARHPRGGSAQPPGSRRVKGSGNPA